MSRKPYVMQDDSPNLVIVPTETYEPCPKKTKLDKLPVNNKSVSALVNKADLNMSVGAKSRNNSVLIDVSKVAKQQSSWASNFLQSIGGSVKPSRLYHSSGTKYIIPRKENAQTNATQSLINQEKIQPKLNNEHTQPKANKEAIHENKNGESINIKLCKETTQPNTDLKHLQANKEAHEPKVKTDITRPIFIRETTHSISNTETSLPKHKKEPTRTKTQTNISVELSQPKAKKKVTCRKSSIETIQANAKTKTSHQKPNKEATQLNLTTESSHVKANKEVPRLKSSKKTTYKNTNKEILQPKYKKEAIQQKSLTETNRPNTVTGVSQSKEANKKIHRLKTTQSNPITENPKAIDYKKCTDQIAAKKIKAKTKRGTVQISPIKPPTTATSLLKREDIKLSLNKFRVMGKNPLESQNNNYTRPKSLNEELNTSTSPIKSVVTKINKNQTPDHHFYKESGYHKHISENQCDREANNDLRTMLKRKLPKNYNNYIDEQRRDHKHHGNKLCVVPNGKGFVPNENLIISFNAERDIEQAEKKQPVKTRMQKQKSGGKKIKKIKLEINITFQNTDTTDDEGLDSNCKNGNNNDFNENTDLSFLDDFDIDEIVESLNDCQSSKPKMKTDMNTNLYTNKTDNMRCGSSTIDGRETDVCSTVQTSHDEFPSVERCSIQDSAMQLKILGQKTFHQNATTTTNDSDLGKYIKNIPANENEVQIVNGLVKLSTKEADDKPNYIADTIKMDINESNSIEMSKKPINESLPDVKNVCFDDEANTSIAQSKSTQKEVKRFTAAEITGVLNPNKNTNSILKDDSKTHQVQIINQDKQIQNITEQQSNFQCSKIENNNRIKEQLLQDKNLKATKLSGNIKSSQNKDDIIITEGSENAKFKGPQYLKEETIIDLTNNLDVSLDDKSDDVIFVDTSTPNLTEIDTEPVLILDTDYGVGMGLELGPSSDEKEKKISPNDSHSNVARLTNKSKTPIETVEKLSNKDICNVYSENKIVNGNETIQRPASNGFVKDAFVRRLEAKLGSKYHITDIVHQGRFSTLYSCEHQNQSKKVIKVLRVLYDHHHFGSYKEDMLVKLQEGVPKHNQNCVFFFKGFLMNIQWCFVMEYFPKNLHDALSINKKSFHVDRVQDLSRQLVTAVTILRNNNIIHSDIKPHHILLDESETRLKLCGFDDAFYYCESNLLPTVGTVNYRAPELIMGFYADYKIDVWSTALVMFEMATNKQLFPGHFNNEILYKQLRTLGNMPYDMIQQSFYSGLHFMDTTFGRNVEPPGTIIFIKEFMKSDMIRYTLYNAYDSDWAKTVNAKVPCQTARDKKKLAEFEKLLSQMLVIHPRRRLAIEFVFANPFIYECYSSC